jgi:hypothetical protein
MLHRHATDVVSLVAGTIFAGLTAVWVLNVSDVLDLEAAWLAGPLILIVAGVVGLVAALRPSGSTQRRGEWPLAPADVEANPVGADSAAPAAEPTVSLNDKESTTEPDDPEPTTAIDDEPTTTIADVEDDGGSTSDDERTNDVRE